VFCAAAPVAQPADAPQACMGSRSRRAANRDPPSCRPTAACASLLDDALDDACASSLLRPESGMSPLMTGGRACARAVAEFAITPHVTWNTPVAFRVTSPNSIRNCRAPAPPPRAPVPLRPSPNGSVCAVNQRQPLQRPSQ
jgi:hypothetical protein